MSMIENIFKLKHKAVEKIVKYSNQMSLRTKIRQGYIVMIILFFFIFVLVVGLEIRNYSGKIIYSTIVSYRITCNNGNQRTLINP